jgi:hypothetical protein
VVTDVISGRPARYIKNKLIDDVTGSGLKPLPIPAQLSLTFPLDALVRAAIVAVVWSVGCTGAGHQCHNTG